jgi:Zinc knuckle
VKLNDEDIASAERAMRAGQNECFLCGEAGHFASYCPTKLQTLPQQKRQYGSAKTATAKNAVAQNKVAKSVASSSSAAYASRFKRSATADVAVSKSSSTYVRNISSSGSSSSSSSSKTKPCARCGHRGHTKDACFANHHKNGEQLCKRCNRQGHTEQDCYARTAV